MLLDKNHFQIVELGKPRAVTSSVCEKTFDPVSKRKEEITETKGSASSACKPPTVQDQNVSYDVTKISLHRTKSGGIEFWTAKN